MSGQRPNPGDDDVRHVPVYPRDLSNTHRDAIEKDRRIIDAKAELNQINSCYGCRIPLSEKDRVIKLRQIVNPDYTYDTYSASQCVKGED